MYDIKQITNYDLSSPVTSYYTITTHIRPNVNIAGGTIKRNVNYAVITFNKDIPKFGYCCEPKALSYPIFIDNKEFQIGKTGMFEIQPEEWINVNDEESYEQETNVTIRSLEVPIGFNFKLDYIYPDN